MSEAITFQRARKPEEQQLRREAILAAAAKLFDAEGPLGAGINAIAAEAGFTKSNVYRYFESREEVLIELFLDEFAQLANEFEAATAPLTPGDVDGVARATANCFAARPRLGRLLAILSNVLEQNVSEATVIKLKQAMSAGALRIAAAVHARLPAATFEDCAWATAMAGTLVAGMWPNAFPSPVAQKVMARPEFSHLKPSIERDLERAARALLRSIVGD